MASEMVPIEELHIAEDNPRKQGAGDVRGLASSIKAVGIIQPLVVSASNGVLVGTRRLAAAKMAKLTHVPVVRWAGDPSELQEVMLIENLQRQDLHPLEEANSLAVLVALGRTQTEIAKRVGMTQQWVSQRLSLLDLPGSATDALHNGVVTIEQARDLAKVADHPEIVDAVVKRIEGGEKNLSISQAVSAEQRLGELRAELEERKAALVAAGTKVLVGDELEGLDGESYLWGDEHGKDAPCYAVGLRIGYGRIEEEELCLDVGSHKTAEDPDDPKWAPKPDSEAKRAEAAAARKVLESASAARREACRELCRRMPSKDTAELIEWALVRPLNDFTDPVLTAWMLELAPPSSDESDLAEWEDTAFDVVYAKAQESDRARQRVALAFALAGVEEDLSANYADWTIPRIRRHFAILRSVVGYEPTETERSRLEPDPSELVDA